MSTIVLGAGDPLNLAFIVIVTVAFQLVGFAIGGGLKIDTVTDLWGGFGFVVNTVILLLLTASYDLRSILLTVQVILWGVRLSGFLFYRILVTKTDKRFDGIREDCCKFFIFWFFQMLWVSSAIAVYVAIAGAPLVAGGPLPLGAADFAGMAMWLVGWLVEVVADAQKFSFRQDSSNKGKWCAVGVWSWSRHPNYFGEVLLWWGLFVQATPIISTLTAAGLPGLWAAICGPLFTVLVLVFGSGVPPLEASLRKRYLGQPGFAAYIANTSVFFPMPPALHRALPLFVKKVLLERWSDTSDEAVAVVKAARQAEEKEKESVKEVAESSDK
eukprot:PLAT11350.1.p1 GENE.PLAT11350.1~~PLAT11350.1.p1  ORF type:complete len:328 (+),score=154.55 PLAT11350.1:38-1021(+)